MEKNIKVRDMIQGEEKTLYQIALKSFSPVEAIGVQRPRKAVVATVDEEIAGAMFLKIFKGSNGRKIGYLDLGFVSKKHRSQGVGGVLYPAAIEKLEDEGCEIITAMVKDDNAASWGLLRRRGFSEYGFIDILREFGITTGLFLWLRTLFCISCSMNFWVSKPVKQQKSLPELACFLLLNLLFLLVNGWIRGSKSGFDHTTIIGGFLVLSAGILAGGIGSAAASGKWRFGLPRGGILMSGVLTALGTFFPLLGRWYPVEYENTEKQKKAMGVQAAVEWLLMLLAYAAVMLLAGEGKLQQRILQMISLVLYCRIIAVFPFEHFGGGRIWRWNKVLYFALTAATLDVLWLL